MDRNFVMAYAKSTGRKQMIPKHWLDDPTLGADFEVTPTQRDHDDAPDDALGEGESTERTWVVPQSRDGALDDPTDPDADQASDNNPADREME